MPATEKSEATKTKGSSLRIHCPLALISYPYRNETQSPERAKVSDFFGGSRPACCLLPGCILFQPIAPTVTFPAMPPPKLPPGLDPVTAGRWGLWLLGKRQHTAKLRRSFSNPTYALRSLLDRATNAICPWPLWRYPGRSNGIAEVLGVSPEYARQMIGGHRPLPARHALTLARYLECDLAERQAVIDELRAHAAQHDARVKRARAECMARAHEASRQRRLRRLRQSLNG